MKESSVIAHGRAQRSERLDTCPSGRTVSAPSQTANERESLSLSGGKATWMAAVWNALHQVRNRYQRQPSFWARGAVRFADVRRTIVEGCTGDPLQSSKLWAQESSAHLWLVICSQKAGKRVSLQTRLTTVLLCEKVSRHETKEEQWYWPDTGPWGQNNSKLY